MCVNNRTSNITLSCLILEGSNKMHQGGIIKISLNRGGGVFRFENCNLQLDHLSGKSGNGSGI